MIRATRGLFAVWIAALLMSAGFSGQICMGAQGEQKIVLDFEEMSEVEGLKKESENAIFDVVQDYSVTSGKNCLRWVCKMGQPWSSLIILDPEKFKDFDKYDFAGLDVYSDHDQEIGLTLELWDKDSVDYFTRASLEEKKIHRGMNTLFWRINRAKRNGKEGRTWEEAEEKDKIDRKNLKKVKLYFSPLKEGGDTKLWIDKLRLLPENAVGGKTEVKLPANAIGYKFGSKFYCPPGFESIPLEDAPKGMPRSAKDCIGTGIIEIGSEWPDTLTGNGLYCPQGDFTFTATNVPPGEYWVWISAGKFLNRDMLSLPYELKVGDVAVVNEKMTEKDFFGEKGIFRYIRTQYSERPNALWLDYVLPEAPEYTCKVKVDESGLPVRITNLRLSALVLMPVKEEAAFKKLCDDIREARVKYFYNKTWIKKQDKPKKLSGAGAYTLWMPKAHEYIRPWSAPAGDQLKTVEFKWKAAQGERLAQRVCITAWDDLGIGDIEITDFQGPSAIPASSIRKYYMNYRFQDASATEMTLLPWTKIRFEPQISWAYWLWMKIPDDAAPGEYTATVTFKPEKGGEKKVPVKLTVYPFKLEDTLPVSYGMYYGAWNFSPKQAPEGYKSAGDYVLALTKEQFKFMREIGFTTTTLPSPFIFEWNMRFEQAQPYWQAAKEAGLCRHPDQRAMTTQLGIARRIARDMFYDMDAKQYGYEWVDRNPGIEFTLPEFRAKHMEYMSKFKEWADKMGIPVAMEVIDEPREVPNPWNRRRDETIRYADWIREEGFTSFVTFIADSNMGKDYTPIVDHIDIVSVHAWENSKLGIAKARKLNKTLWYYNTGMDRLSWGFFNWARGSKGRWEWHFCSPDQGGVEGHPNPIVWYNPFTSLTGYANHAPYLDSQNFPGGMTFQSAFFNVADGINDYAYIYTLEKTIEAAAGNKDKAKAVNEAKAFLDSVRKAIPEYPSISNMASSDSGALVGAGFDTPVAHMTELWRGRIAELLTQLKGK